VYQVVAMAHELRVLRVTKHHDHVTGDATARWHLAKSPEKELGPSDRASRHGDLESHLSARRRWANDAHVRHLLGAPRVQLLQRHFHLVISWCRPALAELRAHPVECRFNIRQIEVLVCK
jgi:hypothetical protein